MEPFVLKLRNKGMTPFPLQRSSKFPFCIGTYTNLAKRTASKEKENTDGL
jgi:hypothetical protein